MSINRLSPSPSFTSISVLSGGDDPFPARSPSIPSDSSLSPSPPPQKSLTEIFFPHLGPDDQFPIQFACALMEPAEKEGILAQVREIVPQTMAAREIGKVIQEFRLNRPDMHTIEQAKRLIQPDMNPNQLILVVDRVAKIEPDQREHLITQALRIIPQKISGELISTILLFLHDIPQKEQREKVVEQILPILRLRMSGEEVSQILIKAVELPSDVLQRVVVLTQGLINDSTDVSEISEIMQGIGRAPAKKMEAVVGQFQRFNTKKMSGEQKKELLIQLGLVPIENLEAVTTQVLAKMTKKVDVSFLFWDARVKRYLPLLMKGLQKDDSEMLDQMEVLISSNSIEKICEFALPFISENMNRDTRLSILEWAKTRLNELPLSFSCAPDLRLAPRSRLFAPNDRLKDLPRDLQWRLYIDRNEQEKGGGPDCFDLQHSEGYREAMDQSLELINQICHLRMNHYLLELLHDVSVESVFDRGRLLQKGYEEGWGYDLNIADIAVNSLEQLNIENVDERLIFTPGLLDHLKSVSTDLSEEESEALINEEKASFLAVAEPTNNPNFFQVWSQFKLGEEWRIGAIFDRFYDEAAAAQTMDEKYAAVACCCRALSVFHAFPDGNGRTICFNLLTILLHQIGSPPSIQKEGGYPFNGTKTVKEMVESIKEGIDYFQRKKIEVLIGEYTEDTPIDRDAPNYSSLSQFYRDLDPFFSKT